MKSLSEELKNEILKQYLNDDDFSQFLKTKQKLINNLAKKMILSQQQIPQPSNLINFLKIYNLRYSLLTEPQSQPAPQNEFKKILELANNFTKENNAKLFFVYLPEYSRYKNNYINTTYEAVKKIVEDLNIPFIDVHSELFNKVEKPLEFFSYKKFGHYSIFGYKETARLIYNLTN